MKKLIFLLVFTVLACKDSKPVNTPKDLISPSKMSEILVDFAINDQMSYLNSAGNMETGTRYILNKHKVEAKAFYESYNYYIAQPRKMERILSNAQDLLEDQDPKAKEYIEKKLLDNGSVPPYAR